MRTIGPQNRGFNTQGGISLSDRLSLPSGQFTGSPNSQISSPLVLLDKHISGYVPSLGADTEHDIALAAGTAADSTGAVTLRSTSSLTKQLDATWATGDAAGGFPSTLTATSDTTYHLFVIGKTDGTVDAGFDTALTATELLATATGFIYKRRAFSFYTTATGGVTAFTAQEEDGSGLRTTLDVPVNDQDANDPGTSAVTVALSVPTDIKLRPVSNVSTNRTANTATYGLGTSLDSADVAPSLTLNNYYCRGDGAQGVGIGMNMMSDIYTDTSGQIRTRLSSSATDLTQRITTMGWVDSRRED